LNSAAAASVEPAAAAGDLNDSTCRDISTSPASLRQNLDAERAVVLPYSEMFSTTVTV
jgi:hypothetical protein